MRLAKFTINTRNFDHFLLKHLQTSRITVTKSEKMKVVLFLTIVLAYECLCQQRYTSKFDNVDVDGILQNERLLKNYMNCLLDKGKCSNDAAELKSK